MCHYVYHQRAQILREFVQASQGKTARANFSWLRKQGILEKSKANGAATSFVDAKQDVLVQFNA